MPVSLRVELQCAGRTSRSGKKGSAQLILYDKDNRSIDDIRKERDSKNASHVDMISDIVERNRNVECLAEIFRKMLSETIFERIYQIEVKKIFG